jgi:hypothetical protein
VFQGNEWLPTGNHITQIREHTKIAQRIDKKKESDGYGRFLHSITVTTADLCTHKSKGNKASTELCLFSEHDYAFTHA